MRVASKIILSEQEAEELRRLAAGQGIPDRIVERARIVLLAAEGRQNLDIANHLDITPRTVARWRDRFQASRLPGIIRGAVRSGRPVTISRETVAAVVRKTTQERPVAGAHWSTRSMARVMGISEASVRRIWNSHGLKPHLTPYKGNFGRESAKPSPLRDSLSQ